MRVFKCITCVEGYVDSYLCIEEALRNHQVQFDQHVNELIKKSRPLLPTIKNYCSKYEMIFPAVCRVSRILTVQVFLKALSRARLFCLSQTITRPNKAVWMLRTLRNLPTILHSCRSVVFSRPACLYLSPEPCVFHLPLYKHTHAHSYTCMCVFVCARERATEQEREGDREKDKSLTH